MKLHPFTKIFFKQLSVVVNETTSIYKDFFQTIKRCCQVDIQATTSFKTMSIGMFLKEATFCYF